MEPQTKE
ncbi:hypothetical protein D041_0436A, partial [Vibrio parahaemolyticus EKP-008]